MTTEDFEISLIEAAEAMDKKESPAIVKMRKESYDFCKSLGLSDEEIQETMALTSHQLRLVKNYKN